MKKILSILGGLVLTFAFVTSVSAATPDNLVGWWKLDETTAGPVIDSKDPASNGVNFGASIGQQGNFGTSYLFDDNDYVSVPDQAELDITDEITIEAWVKANNISGYRTILSKRSGSTSNYSFRLWEGKIQFYYRSVGDTNWSEWYTNAAVFPTDGSWHYLAVSYDFNNYQSLKVYMDSEEYSESDGTWNYGLHEDVLANNYPVTIGNSFASGGQAFAGYLDEIRLWNKILTSEERGMTDTELYNFIYDTDGDGVLNVDDYCPDTAPDSGWDVSWGTNRWELKSDWDWYQNKPAGKGLYNPTKLHELDYTYGCNGHQILALLGDPMKGHYKYGLSSSVLDEFHMDLSDGVLDGRYYVETVTVNSNLITNLSSNSYLSGTKLYLESQGVYSYGPAQADTEWQWRNSAGPWGPAGWISGDLTPVPWAHGLDVVINDAGFDWVGSYPGPSASNLYTLDYTATADGYLNLKVLDDVYGDNSGSLTVRIYADL